MQNYGNQIIEEDSDVELLGEGHDDDDEVMLLAGQPRQDKHRSSSEVQNPFFKFDLDPT